MISTIRQKRQIKNNSQAFSKGLCHLTNLSVFKKLIMVNVNIKKEDRPVEIKKTSIYILSITP